MLQQYSNSIYLIDSEKSLCKPNISSSKKPWCAINEQNKESKENN